MKKVSIEISSGRPSKSILEIANFEMGKVVLFGGDSGVYYGNYALDYLKIFDSVYSRIMNKNNLDDEDIREEFIDEVKRYLIDWNDCINDYIDEIEDVELDASEFKPLDFYDLLDFFIERGCNIHDLEKEMENTIKKIK